MNGSKDTIADVGPGPCVGCPHFTQCRDERLSCAAFNDWVTRHASRKRKRGNPTRKQYESLFTEAA